MLDILDARFGAKPFSTCGGNISAVTYNTVLFVEMNYTMIVLLVNVLVDDKASTGSRSSRRCDGFTVMVHRIFADYPK